MKHALWIVIVLVITVGAQAPKPAPPPVLPAPAAAGKAEPPPTLAETDRLKIINASQAVEIWTLKLQQAAAEVQTARTAFDQLVAAVTPAGWQLNEKLEFVKKEKEPGR